MVTTSVPCIPLEQSRPISVLTSKPVMSVAEVAELFRVNPNTVNRWVRAGDLRPFRTPGGHGRFHTAEIIGFLRNDQQE